MPLLGQGRLKTQKKNDPKNYGHPFSLSLFQEAGSQEEFSALGGRQLELSCRTTRYHGGHQRHPVPNWQYYLLLKPFPLRKAES